MAAPPPIPLDSPWRGVASCFDPRSDIAIDELQLEYVAMTVEIYNTAVVDADHDWPHPPLSEIVYRTLRYDFLHIFRWDTRAFDEIFLHGFHARPQDAGTTDQVYFSLTDHVSRGVRPLAMQGPPHVFISCTSSASYTPSVSEYRNVFRYEIYAPGGINVAESLPDYAFPSQDEVSFVQHIHPSYIFSAQLFRLRPGRILPFATKLIIILSYSTLETTVFQAGAG